MAEKIAKTEFEAIMSNGIDEKNRRIYFGTDGDGDEESGGDFHWESVEAVIRALHKMATDYPKKPIELHMSSYGGETAEMFRLYDAIHECPCQIKFFGSGKIMSSATWIMAGCDERYLSYNTHVMVHKWSGGVSEEDSETDVKISMEYNDRMTERLNQMYADNSRMPADFWEEVTKRDLSLTAEETVMLGLADGIIPYKKRGNLRRKRIAALSRKVDPRAMRKLQNNINNRIQRGKNLKIEIHIPEEEFDKEIMVDDSPIVDQSGTQPTDNSSVQYALEHSQNKESDHDSGPDPLRPNNKLSFSDNQ